MHLTSGFELTTSLTNILIFLVSVYGFITIKKDKLWKLFFFLMSIDSLMGVIVHGLVMTIELNTILWIIMAVLFTITINTFFIIFLKYKVKHIIILSILLTLFMMVLIYFDFDFILFFTLYVLLILIISFYHLIKENIKNKKYFIIGFLIILLIGGVVFTDIKLFGLNHNGFIHIILAISLIFFIKGIKKNS